MALKPLTTRVPGLLGVFEKEFTPTFNVSRSLFEIRDNEGKIIAVGDSLNTLQSHLDRWSADARRSAADSEAPRTSVLIIRWADDLRRRGSTIDSFLPRNLVAFSADQRFQNAAGMMFKNNVDDERETGNGEIRISDTPEHREFADLITRRLGVIRSMIESVVNPQPLASLPLHTADLPVPQGQFSTDNVLVTPDIWALPPVKIRGEANTGTVVSNTKHWVCEAREMKRKTFKIMMDPETGLFTANHSKTFLIPGASTGRSVRECERALQSAVEEHNSRTVLSEGRHLLKVRTFFTQTAKDVPLQRPFPQRDDVPDTVIALDYAHVWLWGGKLWEAAWSDYESVADLKARGQVNIMQKAYQTSDDEVVDWSPETEERLVQACEGIQKVNLLLRTAIENGFRPPEREAAPALPSPEM